MITIACGPPKTGLGPADETTDETVEETTEETANDGAGEASETGDDSTTTATTATILPREDLPTQCDGFAQDCPEGEKCVPYATNGGNWNWNKCVPVSGDQALGEPCTYAGFTEANDDCDQTSMCWNMMEVGGELIGTCHAFCTGSPDEPGCPAKSGCAIAGDEGVVNVCVPYCDPLAQDCVANFACYWNTYDFECAPTSQDIPAGEPCGYINDCAAGLICESEERLPDCLGSTCCTPFCQLGLGDGQCELIPGTSCFPLFNQDEALPGYEHVGVCVLP